MKRLFSPKILIVNPKIEKIDVSIPLSVVHYFKCDIVLVQTMYTSDISKKKDLARVIISSKNGTNQVLVIPGSVAVRRRSRSATPTTRWRGNSQETGPGRYALNGSGSAPLKTRQIMGF